jgi:hypothetical protein
MSTFGNFILNQEYADLTAAGGDPSMGKDIEETNKSQSKLSSCLPD